MLVVGGLLDLMILEVFSNPNDSMILWPGRNTRKLRSFTKPQRAHIVPGRGNKFSILEMSIDLSYFWKNFTLFWDIKSQDLSPSFSTFMVCKGWRAEEERKLSVSLCTHWCWHTGGITLGTEVIVQKLRLIRHQTKFSLQYLAGIYTIWKRNRVLELRDNKLVTRSNARCEGGEPGPRHLCPVLHHTQEPEQDYFPVWGETVTFKFIQTSVTGWCPNSYPLELCNNTLPFLCSSDPWKCRGVNEILFQLLQVKTVQSFFCPISSCVDQEPAAQGSPSQSAPKGGLCSHSHCAFPHIWRTAFPLPPPSDRYCLVWQMLLSLGWGNTNIGFKEDKVIRQLLWVLVRVFNSKDCWTIHYNTNLWRNLNSP